MKPLLCITCILLCVSTVSFSQRTDSTLDKLASFPTRLFKKISNNTAQFEGRITRQTEKYLKRLARKEEKLHDALKDKDSAAAKNIFSGSQEKYNNLIASLHGSQTSQLQEYIPGLDSMQTAMSFLSRAGDKIPGLSAGKLQSIQAASDQFRQLQGKLQQANDISQFIKEREQQLRDQLSQYGLSKQLKSIQNEAFYYQQQLVEYKNLLHDPDKLEQKILTKLNQVPAFADFMQKNSYLGQLFRLPDNYGTAESLVGLQTRDQVQQLLAQSIGSANGNNPEQFVQQQVQLARQAINQLKDKLNFLGNSGGSGDIVMPGSRINNQHVKTFFKRLEYGLDIQTQPATSALPATSSIGGSLGYKINDRTIAGIGLNYRLGLGRPLNHIALSNQGIGIKSYFDLKAKKGLWISGGFEYNFLQEFRTLSSLIKADVWQKSALVGLTKKYKIGKNKQGNLQLLFDALYRDHIPYSSPVILRTGYRF